MRVVSLAPNVTRTIEYLDEEDNLVATTDHGDLKNKKTVGKWLAPDYVEVQELEPDVVFTSDRLQEEIKDKLNLMDINVVHTEPTKISHLVDLVETIGKSINMDGDKLDRQVEKLVHRIHKVREEVSRTQKTVFCEEWNSPPMVAGNWVPEMVDIAGGRYPFVDAGDRSRAVDEEEFIKSEPDIYISHICGQGLKSSFRTFRDRWNYRGKVYFVDDNYVNQLSPDTVKGLEAFADIISDNYRANDTTIYKQKDYKSCF